MAQKNLLILLFVLVIATGAAAAAVFFFPDQPSQPPRLDETGSTNPGIEAVVIANNTFAFDLYSQLLKSEKDNVFYSPYSISAALAMTYEGARGQTADEINSVFSFPKSSVLRPNFAAIYNDISMGAQDSEFRTGNAMWVQQDFPLLADYSATVEKYYGGRATNLDFITESDKSRKTINNYIEKQTNSKIKNLIPTGFLNEMTRIVLTNAVYFKGSWQLKFDTSSTRDEDFKVTPDTLVKVPMMKMEPEDTGFNYAELEDAEVVELPYKGGKISMLILLPTKDLASIESSLTAEKLNEYRSKMNSTRLDLVWLPKFEFDTKYFMKEALSSLGMPTAFSKDSADFSGISGTKELFLDFVIHQAYLKVDEQGTEAAAATVSGTEFAAMSVGMEKELKVFKADRPFMFIIQEQETGIILFIGRVVNPAN